MSRALHRWLWAALFAALLPALIWAQQRLPERNIDVRWERGVPRLSFSAEDLIDEAAEQAIARGISRRLRVVVQGFRQGSNTPLASRSFVCGITFDIWEEAHVVRLGNRSYRFDSLEGAVAKCLRIEGLRVGSRADYRRVGDAPIYFAVRAEFNPIGRARCRAMLQGTSSEQELLGPVVVNIVRRQICRADRSIEFRSPVMPQGQSSP